MHERVSGPNKTNVKNSKENDNDCKAEEEVLNNNSSITPIIIKEDDTGDVIEALVNNSLQKSHVESIGSKNYHPGNTIDLNKNVMVLQTLDIFLKAVNLN